MKLFYSWQSDRPGKTGRHFIREALENAIEALAADVEAEDAERPELDHDTKGIPGSPDLANTILAKIRESVLFIADVTPVAETESGKPLINSNVGIELGYALATIGTEALLMIMNRAHGDRESLPFDLKHKRGPIFYELADGADKAAIDAANKTLVGALKIAIRPFLALPPAELTAPPEQFAETPIAGSAARYFAEGEAIVERRASTGLVVKGLTYAPGPLLYLRLIPNCVMQPLNGADVAEMTSRMSYIGPLRLINFDGYTSGRNRYGGISYTADLENGTLFTTTQVFSNREIWGIDCSSLLLRLPSTNSGDVPIIPTGVYEPLLIDAMRRYRDFARDALNLGCPLTIEAGASSVAGYYLSLDQRYIDRLWGPIYEDIRWRGQLSDFSDAAVNAVLVAMLDAFFAAAGDRRPKNLNDFPEKSPC